MGVRDFYRGLFNDRVGFNPNACGIGTTDPCDWVSNTTVYDNFTARHATFAGGQPNNALADELVERGKLCLFSDTSDAGSVGGV